MKSFYILFLVSILSSAALAQSNIPQVVSFSAVVRDANNQPLVNTPVSIRLTFKKGGATGPLVYCALHQDVSNANGFISLQLNRNVLGTGCNGAPSTTFETIPWKEGGFWMEVEYQTVPNTPFTSLGQLELASSFYAFAAGSAEEIKGVNLQGAQNGFVLAYNQNTGKWEPTPATAGPQGPIGLTGPAGATGPQGPMGLMGQQGLSGATGAQGPIGLTGPAGATGPQGPVGLPGPVGQAGPQGPQGVAGPTGPPGAAGSTGPSGVNGKTSLVKTSSESAGVNCTTGGTKIETGIDANNNSILETSEINTSLTRYICNGAVGQTGATGPSGPGFSNGTATNQMMYWNGSAWTTLNPGSNGQTLTLCNGVLTWTTGGICPPSLATLTTTTVLDITSTTASSGGNITNDGGAAITARGVVWSTTQNPTIALTTKTTDGTGTGSFTSSISGLNLNTLYYVRAYATNSAGTSYGNQVSFTTSNSLFTPGNGVTDVDGNNYQTIIIGDQEWMKENLKTNKYRNGNAMPTNLTNTEWQNTTSGAFSIYNNSAANYTTYGNLYNWYAVVDPRGLCPTGWHVPTDHDWQLLIKYVDSAADTSLCCSNSAGGKMKSTGTIQAGTGLWQDPNTDASNSSGFMGLPGGYRYSTGIYVTIGSNGFWWSSTSFSSTHAGSRLLGSSNSHSSRYTSSFGLKTVGMAVRCLRD